MPSIKLTRRSIASLRPEAADVLYWDAALPGFGVRVSRGGAISYVVQYRPVDGRSRRLTLGGHDRISLEQARSQAKRILGEVAGGLDPAGERERIRREAREARTVAEVIPEYLSELEARARPSVVYEWRRLWTVELLPTLGRTKVGAVTRNQLAQLHIARQGRPVLANRVVTAARAFFAWCEKRGYRDEGTNPARSVEKFRESARERYLSGEELQRLGAALHEAERVGLMPAIAMRRKARSESTRKHRPRGADVPQKANPFAVGAIRFLALSGWRLREALTLRWDMVDLVRGSATLPESKTGRSVRPLGDAAVDLLRSLPRVASSPYVFPSPSDRVAPIGGVARLWRAVREAAKLEGVRLHDLRHTAASFGASTGASLHEIAALLGHKNSATTARYAHLVDESRKRLANQVAGDIASALGRGADSASIEQPTTTVDGLDSSTEPTWLELVTKAKQHISDRYGVPVELIMLGDTQGADRDRARQGR